MKRPLAIFNRDIRSSFREFMLIYMIIAPILLTIGLKFFIPSAESASLQFALEGSLDESIVNEFSKYGDVEIYDNIEDIKTRVKDVDDIAGISINNLGRLKVILEGNESHDTKEMPKKIIREINRKEKIDIDYKTRNLGVQMSPLAIYGSISVIIIAIIMGGIILGLNLIEEKEAGTLRSLHVSPLNKLEFIIGKSIIAIILPIINVYIILWLLEMLNINLIMVFIMTLVSSIISIIIGFLIGSISSNQISGIANLKLIFFILSITIVGAILLPDNKHFLLYWAPTYWSFVGFRDIIIREITWYQLWRYASWTMGLSLVFLILLKNRIKRGLV